MVFKHQYQYDYSLLLGVMREKRYTQESLATKLNMNPSTLNQKLNNKSEFHQSEIKEICSILCIPLSQIERFFFTMWLWKTKV